MNESILNIGVRVRFTYPSSVDGSPKERVGVIEEIDRKNNNMKLREDGMSHVKSYKFNRIIW